MGENITKIIAQNEKLRKQNKQLQQQLLEAKELTNNIKTGNIDALVISNKEDLKVYTEKTADKTYRILVEKMHEGAVTLNENGIILYSNSCFADMMKLPLQKVVGTILKDFVDNSSKGLFEELIKYARDKATKEEVYLSTNESKVIPVQMSATTFKVDNDVVLSIILTDLTIQHKNKIELQRKAEELEQKNMELESVNKELAFQNSEKEKRTADLTILSEDLKARQEELKGANNEILSLNKNLEKRVFERTHELENLTRELKELNISKDKFLSVISHDLRNPLTALLISSDALSLSTENKEFDNIQPYIKIINRTSHNILRQLDELVGWAKMQQEKLTLNTEKLHLVYGVDQGLELLKANAMQKNIGLKNKVPPDIYVNANNLMFRSILQNLVTNAIKYSPESGSIIVNAQPIDKMIEVCITDFGIGMQPHITENLFTNAYSASASGTNNEKGSGLGLKLVKDFVTQHGGTIRVESDLGKGTSVFFTMPKY